MILPGSESTIFFVLPGNLKNFESALFGSVFYLSGVCTARAREVYHMIMTVPCASGGDHGFTIRNAPLVGRDSRQQY